MMNQTLFFIVIIAAILYGVVLLLDRVGPRHIEQNLQRSGNYRAAYFKAHKGVGGKGIYFCPYCGKMMRNPEKIQIDHIYAVHRVQKSRMLREHFKKLPGGVNDLSNLVHSCPRCNQRKGAKGGVWVFLGRYGQYFMPVLRWAAYCGIIYIVGYVTLLGGWKL